MDYKHEQVEFIPGLSAKIWNQDMTGMEMYTPPHWHRSLEFDLVLSGRMQGTVNGKTKTLFPGGEEFFFDVEHHPEIMDALRDYITYIGKIYQEKEAFWDLEIAGQLHLLLLFLAKRTAVRRKTSYSLKKQHNSETIRKVVTYINQNYQEPLTLEAVSSYAGFTSTYFSRFFHKNMGVTFYQYVNDIRLHFAMLDLLNKKATITDCALHNGFPNVKSFIETFKKTYHCTPGQYKKLMR